jgi:serine/threonine-protein kinase
MLAALPATAAAPATLGCFQADQKTADVIAACSAALDTGLPERTRALALSLRADAWRMQGDRAKARQDYDAALALMPDDPELRLARGRLNAGDNRDKDADADFSVVIATPSTRPEIVGEAYARRGALRLKRGATEDGIADLGEARRLSPTDPMPFKIRGTYFLAHNDPAAAVGELSEALARKPDDLEARRARATAYARERKFTDAIADFDAVLARAPDAATLRERGVALLQSGAFARAEQDFTASLAAKPSVETRFLRGNARLQAAAYAGAIADFTAVLQSRATDDEALYGRAMAYQFSGDYAHGEADLSAILGRTPNAARALSQRGSIRFMQAKYQAAGEDFARALSLPQAPADLQVWKFLADARAGAKPVAPAPADVNWPAPVLRYFRGELSGDQVLAAGQATRDPGRVCESYFYLGEAALLQGDAAEAAKLFKAAVATGMQRYTEYAAAAAELGRMKPAE